VVSFDNTPPPTKLLVKVGKETVTVELGPSWFIDELDIEENEEVKLVGEWITDNAIFVAYSLLQGEETITLRDEGGKPLLEWSFSR